MNTTISISHDTQEDIKEFGHKGETYDEILQRLLRQAKDRQLREVLMDDSDTMTLEEARKELKK
ncbi:MAG: hypothetical protein ACLFTH_03020 [Candidatus Woesearchaeota archaeon]